LERWCTANATRETMSPQLSSLSSLCRRKQVAQLGWSTLRYCWSGSSNTCVRQFSNGAEPASWSPNLPKSVRIVEVGPRDGLQNEPKRIETAQKLELIRRLAESGLKTVEATAFVSPKWVPQMSDHQEIMKHLMAAIEGSNADISFPALVPNLKGMEAAVETGVREVAIFASASEAFSKKNINCSIEESLDRFKPVLSCAKSNGIKVRGYVSCVIGCPYEGRVSEESVAKLSKQLIDLGCYEISLGDTIGVGSPGSVSRMIRRVQQDVQTDKLAVHFHDTYGQALANILTSIQLGVAVVDSSVAGLGGCPYAKGATGNVATEDVLYMLEDLNVETGVDLGQVLQAGQYICKELGKENGSRAARALLTKAEKGGAESEKSASAGTDAQMIKKLVLNN